MSRIPLYRVLPDAKVVSRHVPIHAATFQDMYVEPRFALIELSRRRHNSALRNTVIGMGIQKDPLFKKLFSRPRAVLFRQLGTPTHEVLRFLRMARLMELKPLILEFSGDKFVSTANRYKRSLGKMPIYQHTGSDARDLVKYHTLFDFNAFVGESLSHIVCKNGDSLIDVHHRLLQNITHLNPKTICYDATDWFRSKGNGMADGYYEKLLSFFIRDGILFENYFTTHSERPFVERAVIPAFNSIVEHCGYKPLIIELLPENDAHRLFWDSYPKKVERILEQKYGH